MVLLGLDICEEGCDFLINTVCSSLRSMKRLIKNALNSFLIVTLFDFS